MMRTRSSVARTACASSLFVIGGRPMNKLVLFATLSLFAAPFGAQAQSAMDAQQFAQKVAISDMFEIESSKLAADKTKNDGIKNFANHMMTDHQKTTNELK